MWDNYVRSITPLSGGPPAIGAVNHQVRKDDQQDLRIEDLVLGQRVVLETMPRPSPQLQRRMTIEAVNVGTRILDEW
jgi:hypothetical protein